MSDEQASVRLDCDALGRLAAGVLGAERAGPGELALRLVDEAAMTELNERFMGATGATDVLAFPIDTRPAEEGGTVPRLLGDVVICAEVAARQAAARGAETEDEVALLAVHGVLHVLGWDHAAPDEDAAMTARQETLLAELWADRAVVP